MSKAGKIIVGIVLMAVLLFAVSACGGSDSGTTGNVSSNTTPEIKSSQVMMKGNQFDPADLTVTVGTTVTWSNTDSVAHTVAATGGAFSSGNLDPGTNFGYTFNAAGAFDYGCTIHPAMKGKVTVTE
ncbi:MAG: plastocyanin/azurin family copper-binding protein [Thermoleophilia bacterium]